MPGAPYYTEAFSPLPGRRFRMVTEQRGAGSTHCPEPVAWHGSWRAPNGRRYWVEACEGHRPPPVEKRQPGRLASRQVVPAGAKVQVDPAALPLTSSLSRGESSRGL